MNLNNASMPKQPPEDAYRAFVESSSDSIYLVDEKCRYVFGNSEYLSRLGLSLKEIIDRSYGEFHSTEDTEDFTNTIRRVLTTGTPVQHEHKSLRDNRYYSRTFNPVQAHGPDEKITTVAVISKDITEHKYREEKRKESEERYQTILEKIEDGYYEVDLNGKFIFLNNWFLKNLEYSREEMLGNPYHLFTDKENAVNVFQTFHNVYKSGKPDRGVDWTIIKKDGTRMIVESSVSLIKDSEEKPVGFRGIVRDMTERRSMDEKLRKSEEKYRTIIGTIEDCYVELDITGNLVFFNPATCRLLGYSQDELKGMNYRKLVDQEAARKIKQIFVNVFQTGDTVNPVEFDFVRKDGAKVCTEFSVSLMKDAEGHPVGFYGIGHDVTKRRQTEEALKESEKRFRALIEQAAVGVAEIVMETGQFITVNRRLCELAGRTEEELLATTFQAITHPEDLHLHEEKPALLLAGKVGHYSLEKRYLRKDGESVWVNITVSPLWKPGEKPGRNMIVVEDITERRRMEGEIREMSFRDSLTDLYNRRGFITLVEQQLKAANRAKRPMWLTFVDCDGLKSINDTQGHEEGDRALIITATVLRQTFRGSDIIARLGGDEFAILSIDMTELDLEAFSQRLQQNIDDCNAKESQPYKLAISWGTAIYDPESPMSLDELISSADKLMYAHKKAKLNR